MHKIPKITSETYIAENLTDLTKLMTSKEPQQKQSNMLLQDLYNFSLFLTYLFGSLFILLSE